MSLVDAATLTAPPFPYPRELDELPLPCVDIDTQGHIVRANRAALALHHPEHGDLVGKLGWDLMAMDEKVFSQAAFQAQIQAGGEAPTITRSIFDRSGSFRIYQFHRTLIRDPDGKQAGMRLIGVDVTETTRALQEAQRARRWFENAMASMNDALILTDTLGVIRSANPAAGELAGVTTVNLIGRTIEEVLPTAPDRPANTAAFQHRFAIEKHWRGTATILTSAGEKRSIEISTSPIVDRGSVNGVVAILRKLDAARPLPPDT